MSRIMVLGYTVAGLSGAVLRGYDSVLAIQYARFSAGRYTPNDSLGRAFEGQRVHDAIRIRMR